MNTIFDFLNNNLFLLGIVAVCIIILKYILGKDTGKLISKLVKDFLIGVAFAALLYFVFKMPIETVGSIGLIIFIISAIFGGLGRK